ncbi:MAG: excinuclease ABC subunit UvrA, partial [Deltaproteobacteria bacterium]|nr:excinuclease ABC subunit UvrA [Deltaproteobacteria bacterium]
KKDALNFRIAGINIAEASAMTIDKANGFFKGLALNGYEKEVSKEVLRQIISKLEFLSGAGLGYITLNRQTKTLSGGEAQRVLLSNQMGAALSGALYVLDEPSIGLHPRDINMLIGQIKKLSERGNTVIIVEHDPSLIKNADHIVELGPGSGERGGHIVYSGGVKEFLTMSRTITADYLTGRREIPVPRWRRKGRDQSLALKGAKGNNLKNISLNIPLGTLTVITGVSGSGKSTLVMDTLYNALALRFGARTCRPLPYEKIDGAGYLSDIQLIDQSPIGKTPRSNPITYIRGFDDIRRLFAGLSKATALGMSTASFSFNVHGGRCDRCAGQGVVKLEMYFLPDIYVKCEACNGKRYKPQVLDVKYKGKNIFEVLDMTFEEASRFFPDTGELKKKFHLLEEVGLGYLRLGQSATTLSGGEAQRLKIARELAHVKTADVLYILDEPTTGLHTEDIRRLLSVLNRLVDANNTVLVVEHNLDCIKVADHVVDLGPEGGENGGFIMAQGTPEKIARTPESQTGRYLRTVLSTKI